MQRYPYKKMKPYVQEMADEITEGVAKATTPEEVLKALPKPILEVDGANGERMYKVIMLTKKERTMRFLNQQILSVREGFKILSKLNKDGTITGACYFAFVDDNEDWRGRHSIRTIENVSKDRFEKSIKLIIGTVRSAMGDNVDCHVQDYSMFESMQGAFDYGKKTGAMEGQVITGETAKKICKAEKAVKRDNRTDKR